MQIIICNFYGNMQLMAKQLFWSGIQAYSLLTHSWETSSTTLASIQFTMVGKFRQAMTSD